MGSLRTVVTRDAIDDAVGSISASGLTSDVPVRADPEIEEVTESVTSEPLASGKAD